MKPCLESDKRRRGGARDTSRLGWHKGRLGKDDRGKGEMRPGKKKCDFLGRGHVPPLRAEWTVRDRGAGLRRNNGAVESGQRGLCTVGGWQCSEGTVRVHCVLRTDVQVQHERGAVVRSSTLQYITCPNTDAGGTTTIQVRSRSSIQ
jgi:hypothetical protein